MKSPIHFPPFWVIYSLNLCPHLTNVNMLPKQAVWGCCFQACKYALDPPCSSLLPWRPTPLHSACHLVPVGVRKRCTHVFKPLAPVQREEAASRGHSTSQALFKCSDGDATPDLWGECERGGSSPAPRGRLLEEGTGRGEKNKSENEKGLRLKRERRGFMDNPAQRRCHVRADIRIKVEIKHVTHIHRVRNHV